MSKDILTFTQQVSGISLVNYVIDYIDQNMIAYFFLKHFDTIAVKVHVDNNTIVYNISNLDIKDINVFKELTKQQEIEVYGRIYKTNFSIDDEMNRLYITIQPM